MSQIKNRIIEKTVENYETVIELKENNKILGKLRPHNSPTNNCQLSDLNNADLFFKMNTTLISNCLKEVKKWNGKSLIYLSISNRHSYKKFIKCANETKDFKLLQDNEFTNFKNKKSNLILIKVL